MSKRAALLRWLSAAVLLLLLSHAAAQSEPQSLADVQITSISGCVDVYPVTVNCSVATTTLRIQTAAGFPASADLANWRSVYVIAQLDDFSYLHTSALWPDQSDPSGYSIFVNVTASAYFPHLNGVLMNVSFIQYNKWPYVTSPAFAGFSFRFEGPPTLTSIAGCDGSGQATLNCVPDSLMLQLTGSGLLWYASIWNVQLNIGNESSNRLGSYSSLQVVNDTFATLSLVSIYTDLLKKQHYAGVLLPLSLTSYITNADYQRVYSHTTNSLNISFVPLPAPVVQQLYVLHARSRRMHCSYTVVTARR